MSMNRFASALAVSCALMGLSACGDKPAAPAAGTPPANNTPAPAPAPTNGTPTTPPPGAAPVHGGEPARPTEPARPVTPNLAGDPIIGTWVVDLESVKKASIAAAEKQKGEKLSAEELAQVDQMLTAMVGDVVMTLNADGTGSMAGNGEKHTGKWTKDGAIYVIAPDNNPADTLRLKFDGAFLRPDAPADSPEAGMVFKRK